jgi:hypothetical protein
MLVANLDLAHVGALDVAVDARAGLRAGLPVEELVQAIAWAPLAGSPDLQIIAQVQLAQDLPEIAGREHACEQARQLGQAYRGCPALLEQAEDLLDGDSRAEVSVVRSQ